MTQAAIRHYQRANNLTVNGRLDNQTCNKLGIASTWNNNNGMTNNGNNNYNK